MTSEGHILFTISSAILAKKIELSKVLYQGDLWHIIPGSLITCLLPDIDHPKSRLGRRLKWISLPINHTFGHRGFTHSILAVIVYIIIFNFCFISSNIIIPIDAMHGMVLGYCSHILADMLTITGVPLFWPLQFRFRLPIISSSKKNGLERIVCLIILVFSIQHSRGSPLINIDIVNFILQIYNNIYNIV